MGEAVTFPSNGSTCDGYLALPAGDGPGVVVIQEWWGLVPHIKDVCERFAGEGFVAVAPDLYHGKATTEPDEAMKYLMSLEAGQAAKDMSGAVTFLREHERVSPRKVGVVGFCMGGALTLVLGTIADVDALVPYYGIPYDEPDWSKISAPVLGHFAEHDDPGPQKVGELFEKLAAMGKEAELHVYEGAHHGFFNEDNEGAHDPQAAATSWQRTLGFLRSHLS